jgi:uncharacterized protein (DUF1800 family)
MNQEKYSRRKFFSKFVKKYGTNLENDPLFEKYSRKDYSSGRKYQKIVESSTIDGVFSGQELERVNPVTTGLTPYTGTWSTWEALHLLRRTGFGIKKSEVDTLSAMTMSQAVDTVLAINTTVPTPPKVYYNTPTFADENGLNNGDDWTIDPFVTDAFGNDSNFRRFLGLANWSLGQSLNQDITIREKMTLFWYHFIPIDFEVVYQTPNAYAFNNSARICYTYMKMFRNNALGNFKTLIRQVATHPAMMFYLNNNANSNTTPDENFAREILELFTLGKDPLSQYTQDDVIQAAKVVSGWRVQNLNSANPVTNFVANKHNTSTKTFSAFFNNTVITNTGASELDTFINMIFSKSQVVSEYICRRIYRYFVYYDIDATIEANIITPLAQTFVANNWNIYPVLEQLFKSEHFYDMANRGVYIKTPFDLVVGTMRTFNLNHNVSDPTNHTAQYNVWSTLNDWLLAQMEQSMGRIPNVSGWNAFYQNPSFHEYWINSNTTQKRYAYLEYIFTGFNITLNGLTTRIEVDVIAFTQQFSNTIISDPNLLISECVKYLLPIDISTTAKNTIKLQTLLSGQSTDGYWTTAWNNYANNLTNTSFSSIVRTRLKAMLLTISQYSEFQLM